MCFYLPYAYCRLCNPSLTLGAIQNTSGMDYKTEREPIRRQRNDTMTFSLSPETGDTFGAAVIPPLLPERLTHFAEHRAQVTAYLFHTSTGSEEILSFADLAARAGSVARMLHAAGHRPGARLALVFLPGPSFVVAVMGTWLAGCTAVPLAPPASASARTRSEAILSESHCAALLTDAHTISDLRTDWADVLDWLSLILIDGPAPDAPFPDRQTQEGDVAIVQYTSGSTGTPRGVIVTHAALAAQTRAIDRSLKPRGEERVVTWLPPEHDMGLVGGLLYNFWRGGPTYILSPTSFVRRPFIWLDAISRFGATISVAPNFAYDICVRGISSERRKKLDLSSWQVALNGAEPVRPETMDAFVEAFAPHGFDARAFMPCYGLAEATLLVSGAGRCEGATSTWFDPEALERREVRTASVCEGVRLSSSGAVRMTGGVKIVNPETGIPCAREQIGEIWVAGDSLGQGYLNRPDDTQATFRTRLPDGTGPYLRTGDTGFLWQDELYVTGRIKDIVLCHGRTLHAADLERQLNRLDPVLRSGRIAVYQSDDNKVIILAEIVASRLGDDGGNDIARRIMRGFLTESGVEAHEILLIRPGSLLWTTSGKLRRAESLAHVRKDPDRILLDWIAFDLPQKAEGRTRAVNRLRDACADGAPSEDALIAFFADWMIAVADLSEDDFDPDQPWADQGLDSLMITEMVTDLEMTIGREIVADMLFELHTPAALAASLADRSA